MTDCEDEFDSVASCRNQGCAGEVEAMAWDRLGYCDTCHKQHALDWESWGQEGDPVVVNAWLFDEGSRR